MTYTDIVQSINNIKTAVDNYINTGVKSDYLTNSYIDYTINLIDSYINSEEWEIDEVERLYYLRRAQRFLFGLKRTLNYMDSGDVFQDLQDSLIDNFVLFPI